MRSNPHDFMKIKLYKLDRIPRKHATDILDSLPPSPILFCIYDLIASLGAGILGHRHID